MDKKLIKLLLAGNNRYNMDLINDHVGANQELFDKLIKIMLHASTPIPQRAAWAMTTIVDRNPCLAFKQLNKLIDAMPTFKHQALTRSLLRVLCQVDIPNDKMGILFDQCFRLLNDTKQPAAIRVFAMQVLYNIAEREPELKPELKLIIETQLENSSPGLKNRAGKLIAKLNASICVNITIKT